MLKTKSVASFLNTKLNELGQASNTTFKVFASVGDNKASNEIKGIVKRIRGNIEPLINDVDIDYAYICELVVPSAKVNSKLEDVSNLVDDFIEKNNATCLNVDGGNAICTFSSTIPEKYQRTYGVGGNVPIQFMIFVRYTIGAVTSCDKKWFLNGFEIPYLKESILVSKDGITNKISGKQYAETLITKQTRYYNFVFQFDIKNELCTMLQRDLLLGNLDKVYKLQYYDGVSFIKDFKFTTNVSIYQNGNTDTERTKVSMFNLTFVDVDNGEDETKYYLALIDSEFDLNSENTRYFSAKPGKTAQEVQIDYYLDKVSKGARFEQIKAPNLDSIDITSQVYKNTANYDLFDLTNKNYAIIKVEKGGVVQRYYYYWVTNQSIGADNQVLFDLKQDTVQTYLFNDNLEIPECFIEKAHLNRFEETNEPSIVKFRGGVYSDLFVREDVHNVPKRLVVRKKLDIMLDLNSIDTMSEFDKYLKENVECWVYCYIKPDEYKYSFKPNEGQVGLSITIDHIVPSLVQRFYPSEDDNNGSMFIMPYGCVVYPIMKQTKNANGINVDGREWGFDGFAKFVKYVKEVEPNIYNMKFSSVPPFWTSYYTKVEKTPSKPTGYEYNIVDGILELFTKKEDVSGYSNYRFANMGFSYFRYNETKNRAIGSIGVIDRSRDNGETFYFNTSTEASVLYEFPKADIMNSNKKAIFNPKLLSEDFCSLRITNGTDYFDYDFQKINEKEINFLITEALTPDITRSYVRYNAPPTLNTDSIYIKPTDENYTGLVSQQDTSIPYSVNQLSTFLANNKNFFLQRNIATGKQALNTIFGTVAGLNLTKSPGAIAGAGLSVVNMITDRINSNLTLDNMKNAPESLHNANGNVILNETVGQIGNYIEVYKCLQQDLESANDLMFRYGFNYNRTGNIKDFINIRKYFNFVKAQIESVKGVPMSNTARADFRERFANGIRFWNTDVIQYEKENYERWLEA